VLVADHVRRAARLYAQQTAAICGAEKRSFAEVDERSDRLCNALLAMGLQAGDRVAAFLENSIRCLEVDFGLAKAGLVRVSLNPSATAAELDYILGDAEPRAIVFDQKFAPLVSPSLSRHACIRHAVCVAIEGGDAECDYESLLAGAEREPARTQIQESDLYCIAYTSGSTGKPKGVMLSQRAMVQVAYNVLLELGPQGPAESVLLLQPLSHGSAYFVLPYFMRGCATVLMRQFDAVHAIGLMEQLRIETVKLVPTMLHRMLAVPKLAQVELPKLRQIIYSGSPIAADLLRRAMDVFGARLAQHYGQTEAPSTITVLPRHEHTPENLDGGLLASAGRPFATVDVRVAGDDGRIVACGEVGEVQVRAPHLMSGYWKRPDMWSAAVCDGWLRTNDLGRLDERGYLFLLGRKDEMIISGGYNIAPREVEDALCAHPAVSEAAVLGRADPEWGQRVVALVSLRDKSVPMAQLMDHCRNLLGYKRPKEIVVLGDLPKNANGKIDKAALARMI